MASKINHKLLLTGHHKQELPNIHHGIAHKPYLHIANSKKLILQLALMLG